MMHLFDRARLPRTIICLRMLVISFVISTATIIGTLTFIYIRNYEDTMFQNQYLSAATLMSRGISKNINNKFIACDEITSVFSFGFSDKEWPNVTFSNYCDVTTNLLRLSQSTWIGFLPIVSSTIRKEWESYAATHYNLQGFSPEESNNFFHGYGEWAVTKGIRAHNDSSDESYYDTPTTPGSIYPNIKTPIWQECPLEGSSVDVMWNAHSSPSRYPAIDAAIKLKSPAFSDIVHLYDNTNLNLLRPGIALHCPIVSLYDGKVLGLHYFTSYWDDTLSLSLPSHIKGIQLVLSSSTQQYTFAVDGNTVVLIGAGDLHDTHFNSYVHTMTVRSALASFRFDIYPTVTLQNLYYTNTPMYSAIGVVFVTCATALFFFIYEIMTYKRTNDLQRAADASSAIVEQFIPAPILDRFLRHLMNKKYGTDGTITPGSNHRTTRHVSNGTSIAVNDIDSNIRISKLSNILKSMSLKHKKNNNIELNKHAIKLDNDDDNDVIDEELVPLADQYDSATVMFADVAGFTSWSSYHTPKEVFDFLESIFSEFDTIANIHGAYKIETVGDW